MRILALLLLASASACASLSFKPERRLNEADLGYRVRTLGVLPLALTSRACPEEIDKRARTSEVAALITQTALDRIKTRGYRVVALASDADPKSAFNRALGDALCSGKDLRALPAEVIAHAAEVGAKAGADQVFLGGFSRLRWHLKMDLGDENNGAGGNDVSQFEVRAAAAILDVAQKRVVWTENVETSLYTGSYKDAIERVLLFSELKHTDPHEKLFYDLPAPSSPAGASSAAAR